MLLQMIFPLLAIAFGHFSLVFSQTFTNCDPLQKSCPPNPALGESVKFDLTKAPLKDWSPTKDIKYDGNGGSFTIEKDGMKAEVQSNFYIMFGKVDVTLKVSPGRGIVSSVVLQSECGDEVDLEWIGGDNMQVQTNYFAKRKPDHTRGGFHPNPDNQNNFRTYSIDWDSERIIWEIDGATIRVAKSAESAGNYPQTPAYVKVGNWAGGDSSRNPPGTVDWAGGEVDYSLAPFTMQVKSIKVTDYSTGKQYEYTDRTGTWQSIKAVDGKVNSRSPGDGIEDPPTTTASTAISATTSQKTCGSSGPTDAKCSNGPSDPESTSATSTNPGNGPEQTNGASNGPPRSTPTPSKDGSNPSEGTRSQAPMHNVVRIACILFSALVATF
ncbi:hypothetical protein AJ78_00499 [Emergomyces pasteurianus Ep9510]|uniref:Crh-like protein n=1 Tax=Emergomyces pasteurianus Ep9510 TaxID=1447872 RepID=A0A1J9PSY4_9EURO|nr:hypothetical protein AJ78_00499 [Emergomyces pasteurianus Ep9510]